MTRPGWTPVPMPWRAVQAGDNVVADDQSVWHVLGISAGGPADRVTVVRGPARWDGPRDPDELVDVLMAVPDVDAVDELHRQGLLGERVRLVTTSTAATG